MQFRIQRFLCHQLQLSNEEVLVLLKEKRVRINSTLALPNQTISHRDTIELDTKVLQTGTAFHYFAFHKPRGIECTTNPDIADNILPFVPKEGVYLVGRLDKDSEGLIFFTDDDKFYNAVADNKSGCEKEYYVETDKPISDEDIVAMESGIKILGQVTRPCKIFREGPNSFRIILTQGLNRQIRRMCYKRGMHVSTLKRIRIGNYLLNSKPGMCVALSPQELASFS